MTNASVILATRDRPEALQATLAQLFVAAAAFPSCELIVVDDGSTPEAAPDLTQAPVPTRILRTQGIGRSAARNLGASAALGAVLVFIDDDITVGEGFIQEHVLAQTCWPGALAVGDIRLPLATQATPFGRFRQRLEEGPLVDATPERMPANFCASGNMSMSREGFLALGGFDLCLHSAEDQDLALRHSSVGGRIVFLRKASVIHRDQALDIRSYCRRAEWGAETMVSFCRKYPDFADNIERQRVNGPSLWGHESVSLSAKKSAKWILGFAPHRALLLVAAVLERLAPKTPLLHALYRVLLGIHLQRGHRRGLRLADRESCPEGHDDDAAWRRRLCRRPPTRRRR